MDKVPWTKFRGQGIFNCRCKKIDGRFVKSITKNLDSFFVYFNFRIDKVGRKKETAHVLF